MESLIAPSPGAFAALPFEYLIVGGGTAGLAVAARLASHSSSPRVGVLEAGPPIPPDLDDVAIPAYYGRSLGGEYDWRFQTTPQPGLGGRALPWPRGRALGGTSALNFMAWNRAAREDYDAWEALGNAGWGWDDLLPFFKKSETFHPPSEALRKQYDVSHDPEMFGDSGPIHISYSSDYSSSHRLWHRTLHALGVQTNKAHMGGSNVGVWTNVNTVDPEMAGRSYATSYLSSLGPKANLHILTEATVEEIVLREVGDEFVATGVRFTCQGGEHVVSASREVILSAGSVKSPQILELSGIGNPDILAKAGVPVKVNSPKVGENLQDHLSTPPTVVAGLATDRFAVLAMIFEVDPSLANPDDLKKDEALAAAAREQHSRDRSGPLTILPCSICYVPLAHFVQSESLARLHAQSADLTAHGAEKKAILRRRLDGGAKLGQVEYIFDLGNWSPYFEGTAGKKYGTMLQILQYPFSLGSVHIRALKDGQLAAEDKGCIDPAYYGGAHGELDAAVMKECVRFASGIVRTAPLSGIIRAPASPSAETLADGGKLEEWIVQNTITDWHPVGTCGMGGRGGIRDGVVDERLRVYEVKGLRVVDASVMPLQICAHLQATVYAIAEKGAHMILEDASSDPKA